MLTIGQSIKKHRKAFGVNGKEFAATVGISGSRLSQWERDKYLPNILVLWAMADTLGMSIDELIGRTQKDGE